MFTELQKLTKKLIPRLCIFIGRGGKKKSKRSHQNKRAYAVMSSLAPRRPLLFQLAEASVLRSRVRQHVRAATPGRGWQWWRLGPGSGHQAAGCWWAAERTSVGWRESGQRRRGTAAAGGPAAAASAGRATPAADPGRVGSKDGARRKGKWRFWSRKEGKWDKERMRRRKKCATIGKKQLTVVIYAILRGKLSADLCALIYLW